MNTPVNGPALVQLLPAFFGRTPRSHGRWLPIRKEKDHVERGGLIQGGERLIRLPESLGAVRRTGASDAVDDRAHGSSSGVEVRCQREVQPGTGLANVISPTLSVPLENLLTKPVAALFAGVHEPLLARGSGAVHHDDHIDVPSARSGRSRPPSSSGSCRTNS